MRHRLHGSPWPRTNPERPIKNGSSAKSRPLLPLTILTNKLEAIRVAPLSSNPRSVHVCNSRSHGIYTAECLQAETGDPYSETHVLDLGVGDNDCEKGGFLYQGSIIALQADSLEEIKTLELEAKIAGDLNNVAFLSGMRCVILAKARRLSELDRC